MIRKFRTVVVDNIVKIEEWKTSVWEPEFFDWFEPTLKTVYFSDNTAALRYLTREFSELEFNNKVYMNENN